MISTTTGPLSTVSPCRRLSGPLPRDGRVVNPPWFAYGLVNFTVIADVPLTFLLKIQTAPKVCKVLVDIPSG